MLEQSFTMTDPLGIPLHVYHWLPDSPSAVKGILQIAHGMCETAERYARFAASLTEAGYAVYANDQRGHGLTAGSLERLGDAGKNGFEWMIRDILQLRGIVEERHPNVPVFLMGHSMGSFLVQKIIARHHEAFAGFILSGTNGPRGMLRAGLATAHLQIKLQGETHRSLLLNALVFGSFNRRFSPARTHFDWLSRDPEEVDKYIEDPFCGTICTAGFFRDFFKLLQEIQEPGIYAGVNKNRPIYLFSGEHDPVGLAGKGVRRLEAIYRKIGVQDVECRLYAEGRHEMLNEINRDEVAGDVINWLERHA